MARTQPLVSARKFNMASWWDKQGDHPGYWQGVAWAVTRSIPTPPRSSWLLWYFLQTSSTSILQTLATQVTEARPQCGVYDVPCARVWAKQHQHFQTSGLARSGEIECIQRKARGASLEIRASSLIRALTCFLSGSSPNLSSGNLTFVSVTSPAS